MAEQSKFLIKIVGLSAVLSVLVKYGGRVLDLAPTPVNALVIVLLPVAIVGGVLGWRSRIS
jgi:hypothetical protein